jgi:hypothetical protein
MSETEINELATQNKNIRDLYRGIKEFRNGYQPRTTLVKGETVNYLQTPQFE